jgi:hypothetical protein
MSKRKRVKVPKKRSKKEAIDFGKMLDEYFKGVSGLMDDRFSVDRYDFFFKNKWLGKFRIKRDK